MEIPVGEFPTAVAAGEGAVWVTAGFEVVRVDPSTSRVVRIDPGVPVGSERTCDIGVGAGAVWAVGAWSGNRAALVRIDPVTNRARIVARLREAACVAAGPAGIWVTSPARGVVTRLDPKTGRVRARIRTDGFCDGVATRGRSVWIACQGDGLLRVDPRTNRVVEVLRDIVSAGRVASGPAGLFADGATLDYSQRALVRLEPSPRRVFLGRWGFLAVGRHAVWVSSGRRLRRVDSGTGRLLAEPIRVGKHAFGMAVGFGAVWVATYQKDGTVVRIPIREAVSAARRRAASACRRAPAGGSGPAGSSTTKELVPGKRWFCQFGAVPAGQRMRRKGMPASSA